MSAIFGIIRFDGAEAEGKLVARMAATLRHRTPDGVEIAPLGPVCLGHGRMRIYREDIFDDQPLSDGSGNVTLVLDGRLDNRDDLAAALDIDPGTLRDLPDSALLLAAYRRWGMECSAQLLGDFAFAIWDAPARTLLLSRDHMGQRQLYFHRGDGFLAFASEIKALWALPDIPRVLNDDAALRRMLVLRDAKAPPTLFDGIEGLRGGESAIFGRDGTIERRRYWTPRAAPEHEGQNEAYYVAAYRRILGEAVSCRIRRLERRPALHLSGGFDSSAIAGLAGPVLREQGRTILGIASVMPESRRGEFFRDARPMVEHCARDMPHLDVHFMTREGIEPFGGLDEAMPLLDGPPSPLHYLYQEAARIARRDGIRLLMDGHGGDYTLNPRDPGGAARYLARGDLRGYVREVRALRARFGTPLVRLLASHTRQIVEPFVIRFKRRVGLRVTGLGLERFVRSATRDRIVAANVVRRGEFGVDTGAQIDGRRTLARALGLVADRVTAGAIDMAAHAEGVVMTRAFHDKRVVELALAIPESLYFRGGRNRYLARIALADIYPPEFQDRGFHNHGRIPDLAEALAAAAPQLADRARNLPDDLVDRAALADALRADEPSIERKSSALMVLMVADYRRWFSGRNTS